MSKFTSGGRAGLDARAGAVLAAWRPGCEGGVALWDLLTGRASPSGRLAQSWPISVGTVRIGGPGDYLMKYPSEMASGFTLGAPFAPAYPFGHGLDYLDVSFGHIGAVVDEPNRHVNVSVELLNAAARGGGYVVQVYFNQAVSRYTRYEAMLGGFVKVALPPKGTTTVRVDIPYADMAYWDPRGAGTMVLEAGAYTLFVCRSSDRATCALGMQVSIPTTVSGL